MGEVRFFCQPATVVRGSASSSDCWEKLDPQRICLQLLVGVKTRRTNTAHWPDVDSSSPPQPIDIYNKSCHRRRCRRSSSSRCRSTTWTCMASRARPAAIFLALPCAERTLNATDQSRVTLSLRQEHVKSSLCAAAGGERPDFRPKTSQAARRRGRSSCQSPRCGSARGTGARHGRRSATSPRPARRRASSTRCRCNGTHPLFKKDLPHRAHEPPARGVELIPVSRAPSI